MDETRLPSGRAASGRPPGCSNTRFTGGLLLVFLLGVMQGCYVYSPVSAAPSPGMVVALDLTDRGRADLGDLVGSGAARIEGTLQSETDSAYMLNVASVRYQRGVTAVWSGEPVTVGKTAVYRVSERQFSRGRTFVAAGAVIAAIVAIASRNISGFGADRPPDGGCDPVCEQ